MTLVKHLGFRFRRVSFDLAALMWQEFKFSLNNLKICQYKSCSVFHEAHFCQLEISKMLSGTASKTWTKADEPGVHHVFTHVDSRSPLIQTFLVWSTFMKVVEDDEVNNFAFWRF